MVFDAGAGLWILSSRWRLSEDTWGADCVKAEAEQDEMVAVGWAF